MAHDEHHEHLIKEVAEIYEPVLTNSPQAIYIYLDDTHKICNQKFADLLGYKSIEEWVANENPIGDIAESDQNSVIEAYGKASEANEASFLSATAATKGGSEVEIDLIMVPFSYKNEVFVIHFISEK
jgi:hypothetical protein